MDVLIVGAGAVGLGLGSFLLETGASTHLVGRPATCAALAAHGLHRSGIFGTYLATADRFRAASSLAELPVAPYDYILVCTKSFDSESTAVQLAASAVAGSDECPIVLCQNGWGNAEVFTRHFPQQRIFNARVITGFARTEPHQVALTVHADAIRMGSLFHTGQAVLEPLCAALTAAGLPAETTPTIERDLWAKMLYNCCLNPLGAILEVPYGHLGDVAPTRAIMEQVAAEVFRVMERAGYHTHWERVAEFLDAFYGQMLPPTSAHESSMLQDVRAERQTEIDALCGAVVRLGAQLKVTTPANALLQQLILFKQNSTRRRSSQIPPTRRADPGQPV
jgi:2-dehydropantoate 2-reductase